MSPATSIRSRAQLALSLGVLSLALVSCGGGDVTSPTGGINIAPNTISFTTAPGGTLDPKSVGITPATVDLTGLTATTVFVGTPPSEWLATSLSKSDASLASPAILALQITNTNLPTGTYSATVTIQSPDAGNAPKVSVTLTVQGAAALSLATQPSSAAASGTVLAQSPVVQLQTADGTPVAQAGVDVSVAVENGGSVSGPATVTTDAQGQATFTGLAVTALVGEHTLLFTASGLTEVRSNPVAITVGAPTTIAAGSVTPQSAEAGTPANDPPAALVTDGAGNPVAGVAVTFAVTQGGGTIDPTAPATQTSTADGLAKLNGWILGAVAGDNAVTATAAGLSGSPVEFDAKGTNGGVTPGPIDGTKSTVAASPRSFVAGSPTGTTITVTARDANNVLISGATVQLTVGGNNNQFTSSLTTGTGASLGRATTTLTSTTAEVKSITAQITATGVTVTPTASSVTVTAGPPDGGTSTVTASPQTVTGLVNGSSPSTSLVTVTVKDVNGNPVSGRSVSLDVGTAIGAVLSAPAVTGSSGQTTMTISSTTGGNYQVHATIDGVVSIPQTASINFLLSFASDIKAAIFDVGFTLGGDSGTTSPCSSCHKPDNGQSPSLSLDSLPTLHDGVKVVDPGNANGSLLIKALLHDVGQEDEKMPNSTQFLPGDVIAKIRQWINQNGTGPLTP